MPAASPLLFLPPPPHRPLHGSLAHFHPFGSPSSVPCSRSPFGSRSCSHSHSPSLLARSLFTLTLLARTFTLTLLARAHTPLLFRVCSHTPSWLACSHSPFGSHSCFARAHTHPPNGSHAYPHIHPIHSHALTLILKFTLLARAYRLPSHSPSWFALALLHIHPLGSHVLTLTLLVHMSSHSPSWFT